MDTGIAAAFGAQSPSKEHRSAAEKIAAKVAIHPNGCWEWQGSLAAHGYGTVTFKKPIQEYMRDLGVLTGKSLYNHRAHRAAYALAYGQIASGEHICHRCDNPSCCNPAHLFAGTQSENMVDMLEKGRGRYQNGPGSPRRQRPYKLKFGPFMPAASKLTEAQVMQIIGSNDSAASIARQFGINVSHVYRLKSGEQRKAAFLAGREI